MFEFENSPNHEMKNVTGIGYSTIVRAKQSGGGKYEDVHGIAPDVSDVPADVLLAFIANVRMAKREDEETLVSAANASGLASFLESKGVAATNLGASLVTLWPTLVDAATRLVGG